MEGISPIWIALGGIMFLLIGLYVQTRGTEADSTVDKAADWPTEFAVISKFDVRQVSPLEYACEAEYVYEVKGRSYRGHRIARGPQDLGINSPPTYDRATSEQMARRYAPGNKVMIHYDPDRPESAVLEAHGTQTGSALGLIGALLIILGGCAILTAIGVFIVMAD
jgi:hypothetical protein